VASRCPARFRLAASISRSTSRSVRYSRLRLPTVTFTEVGADFRSRAFSMEIALPPTRTVTNLTGRVTESKSRDHRIRGGQHSSPFGPPPDFELSDCGCAPKVGWSLRRHNRRLLNPAAGAFSWSLVAAQKERTSDFFD
jgi:hypothetical protein